MFIQLLLTSIQDFNKIAMLLTSMLKISSSTDSSASAIQIAIEYDGVDGDSGKLVKKLLKSQKIVKSWKTSRA